MTDTLVLALIGHLVGDYLLQNDWMALNKKWKPNPYPVFSWKWWFTNEDGMMSCYVHCFLWATAVCLFAGCVGEVGLAAGVQDSRGEETQVASGPRDIQFAGQRDGLARIHALCVGKALQIFLDEIRHAQQIPGAFGHRQLGPGRERIGGG